MGAVARKPIMAFYDTRIGSVEVAYSMDSILKWQKEFQYYVIAVAVAMNRSVR